MHPDYRQLLEKRFLQGLPEEGPDKRMDAAEAVARFTRPGMSIHAASTQTRPYALGHALIRRYWKQKPGIDLSVINMGENWAAFVTGGIVRRVITTFGGEVWPNPAPNPIINQAWLEKKFEIQHWSILTFTLRLLAGALRVPFLPTRSVLGTTMAEDNGADGDFKVLDDPFGGGGKIGLVKAYRPDLCLIHATAADRAGNAIICTPSGEGALGAFAAKEGAIVSAERIVSTDFLRKHNHLVKIPAHLVKAVVELPFGGHPRGVTNVGAPELPCYADDYRFLFELRQATKDGERGMERWVEKWILSCERHEQFLEKLGIDRLRALRGRAQGAGWYEDVVTQSGGGIGENDRAAALSPEADDFLGSEMMIVAAGRKMAQLAKEEGLAHILAGVGAANLSAWLCLHRLRDEAYPIQTMAEIGYFGYDPRPGDPYIFNFKNTPTCVSTTDILTVLGFLVGDGRNLGSLGAAQVDRCGNVNTTMIPGKLHLLGSGGGNDVASAAKAVVVTAYLGREKFLEEVDYVTSPGTNVRAVVTDHGVLEKSAGGEDLVLTGYYTSGPSGHPSAEDAARSIRELVGWNLKVAEKLEPIAAPTPEELRLLRLFDPFRQFLK